MASISNCRLALPTSSLLQLTNAIQACINMLSLFSSFISFILLIEKISEHKNETSSCKLVESFLATFVISLLVHLLSALHFRRCDVPLSSFFCSKNQQSNAAFKFVHLISHHVCMLMFTLSGVSPLGLYSSIHTSLTGSTGTSGPKS